MENASKALIIAGAILLAILLISLGIMIFNQAKDVVSGSGMTQAEVQAFNQKFTKHEGNQKGSTIRSMVQEVIANNNSQEASDETRVSINLTNINITTSVQPGGGYNYLLRLEAAPDKQPVYGSLYGKPFSNTSTYNVSCKYYNGRVILIEVKPVN